MAVFPLLTDDVLLHILGLLHAKDVIFCSMTSRRLYALIKSSSQLQLIIELFVEGFRPREGSLQSNFLGTAVQKREALQKYRDSRQALEPPHKSYIPQYDSCFFAQGDLIGEAVPTPHRRFRSLEFRRLSSTDTRTESNLWKIYMDVGLFVIDFVFDREQDLLVLVQNPLLTDNDGGYSQRVFIHTLSQNLPHPKATYPCLRFPVLVHWRHCDVKICGDLLSIYVCNTSVHGGAYNQLFVWNWCTGEVLLSLADIGGYAFLTPTVLFLLVKKRGSINREQIEIKILRLSADRQILRFSNADAAVITLELPLRSIPSRVIVTSDVPVAESSRYLPDRMVDSFVPEETAERIIYLRFLGTNHRIFLSTRRLIQLFNGYEASSSTDDPHPDFYRWTEWSPDASFWFPLPLISVSLLSIYGSQFCAVADFSQATEQHLDMARKIGLDPDIAGDQKLMFLMDFNPRPIALMKRDGIEYPSREWHWDLGEETTEPIVSRLQCRIFQKKQVRICDVLYITHFRLFAGIDEEYEVMQFF
ncbi:hypothetical protein CPB86DRAFT_790423, partial [Serendipita vermifera]